MSLLDSHISYNPATHRSGYVALTGKPNAGKSTLMNAFVGAKLSIVTDKPQTTRNRVIGICSDTDNQIIFVDTPGLITPKYKLHKTMMNYVERAKNEADLIFFLIDATNPEYPEHAYLSLKNINKPIYAIINKIDLIPQITVIEIMSSLNKRLKWDKIFPISALTGAGVEGVMHHIKTVLPLGPPFYPKDMISEHPERFFVSEIIREKVFELYHDEIPYSSAVTIIQYQETESRDIIEAEIIVDRESQKGIIIGKGGRAIKQLGTTARKGIASFIGKPIHLNLFVKVRSKWRENDTFLNDFGYRNN